PGGAKEALYSTPEKDVLYLRKRSGFIKLALKNGISIVPVFSFNENNPFSQLSVNEHPKLQMINAWSQTLLGVSLPVLMNIVPRKTRITVVVGKAISLPKIEEPDEEIVEKYLQEYIEILKKMYNEFSPRYSIPPTKTLEIV